MASPSVAISRFDLSMGYSEFSLAAQRRGFVGLQILPSIGVAKDSGSFAKLELAELLKKPEATERAPRAEYKRDGFQWTTDSYDCKEHGVEEVVDDLLIERYGDILRAESISAERAIHRILMRLETEIASAVFNTSTWTGSALTTAAGTAWTTAATSSPISDIRAAIRKVRASCGMRPNTLILSDYAFEKLVETTDYQDNINGTGFLDPRRMEDQDNLRILFQLDNIIVPRSYYNTSDEGQSASMSAMWSQTMAMVCHISDDGYNGDLESFTPCIGRTIFASSGNATIPGMDDGEGSLIMEEYREESRRGGILRARNKRHIKILHAAAGHLLTAVTA